MGQVGGVLGGLAVQPRDVHGGAALAPELGLNGFHAGQVRDVGAVHGGEVIPHGDARLMGRGVIVDLGHLGVAGLVDGQLHADAHEGAVLGVHQVCITLGGIIPGVFIAGAQQVARRQAVVQGRFVDGIIIVAADVLIHLRDLIIHALLFLHAGNGAVKQAHRHQHGDGEGHGHGKDDDADRHANGYLAIHSCFSLPLRPAAS